MTVGQMFDAFLLAKRLAGLSGKSIEDYAQLIKPFINFVGAGVSIVTQEHIKDYLLTLVEKDISKATLSTYIRNLKVFLKWMSDNYTVQYDYRFVKVPKNPKKRVKIYSDEEISIIFDTIGAEDDWLVTRNKAIVALMYDSGLRRAEVCNLKMKNVSFSQMRLTVQGKGDKERVVPLGGYTMQYLKSYMNKCPYDSKFVFVGRFGDPLTDNAVKQFINKLAHELPFELSCHKLRHNFATNYCLDQYERYGQVDIFRLMILMGHEDIETTKRYLHLAYEIIAARDSVSHLDKINGV